MSCSLTSTCRYDVLAYKKHVYVSHMLTDCGCCISVSSHTLRLQMLHQCVQCPVTLLQAVGATLLYPVIFSQVVWCSIWSSWYHTFDLNVHQLEYLKIFYKKINFGRLPWNRFLLASGMIENVYCSLTFQQYYHAVLTPDVVTKIKLTEDTVLDQNDQQKNS